MSVNRGNILRILVAAILLAAGVHLGRGLGEQVDTEPPFAYVMGNQISVYYPSQKKIYVYTQLGGNCVYAYTLTTPGGAIERENCR